MLRSASIHSSETYFNWKISWSDILIKRFVNKVCAFSFHIVMTSCVFRLGMSSLYALSCCSLYAISYAVIVRIRITTTA